MKKNLLTFVLTATLLFCMSFSNISTISAETAGTIKYEFEDGIITGTAEIREDESASGGKYAFLGVKGNTITITVNAEKTGMYSLNICYKAAYGEKVQDIFVNGVYQTNISCTNPEWTVTKACTVNLNAGENEISVKSYWGWCNFDYFTISPVAVSKVSASQTNTCDPCATPETKSLMSYLASIYGNHILSGQQEIYRYGHNQNYEQEFDYLLETTGRLPAVRGFDYIAYSAQVGEPYNIQNDYTTDRIIDWVKTNNGIATSSWHLTVPKDFENYNIGDKASEATYFSKENSKPATNFDTSQAIVKGTKEYQYYQICLQILANELTKLQNEGVPIIFRPLHEAEGGWFWWAKDGAEVYKELWKLTYETLTEKYNLHNIIWEWNSFNYETSSDWYPGDAYVDIIAFDKYSCRDNSKDIYIHNDSPMTSIFNGIMERYDCKKMVTMAETDCFSTPEKLIEEKAGWLYFCTWFDGDTDTSNPQYLTDPTFNTVEDTINMYNSEYCITRDELPANLYTSYSEHVKGDVNADGIFNAADVIMMQKWLLCAGDLTYWQAGDLYKDDIINVFDLCLMKRILIEQ